LAEPSRLLDAQPPILIDECSGHLMSASRWRELIDAAPAVDDDFARDVEAGRNAFGPPSGAWPS
jgi:hypothetical protein